MRRSTLAAVAFAALLLAAGATARAQNATSGDGGHVPSQRDLSPGLIYEQGASANSARGASPERALLASGRELYDTHCTSCHGAALGGTPGVPSLLHDGGASVDFYLTTGRMPDTQTSGQAIHTAPHFTPRQIAALDAYVTSRAATAVPIPAVRLDRALLQRGRMLFESNCEACHGAAAEGATAGEGWIALPLDRATPAQLGEAIRIGPGVMPRFTTAQLSAADVDALATYVEYLNNGTTSYGGFMLGDLGPAAEGAVGGILGVGTLFWVIFFTGTKADGTRLHERR